MGGGGAGEFSRGGGVPHKQTGGAGRGSGVGGRGNHGISQVTPLGPPPTPWTSQPPFLGFDLRFLQGCRMLTGNATYFLAPISLWTYTKAIECYIPLIQPRLAQQITQTRIISVKLVPLPSSRTPVQSPPCKAAQNIFYQLSCLGNPPAPYPPAYVFWILNGSGPIYIQA